jgi:DNA polymerase-1
MYTLDFETVAIEGNPLINPPRPVGLAVEDSKGNTDYITDLQEMENAVRLAISKGPVLFHHAPFDLSVAERHLGVPMPHWSVIHDTLYLMFLLDPYATSLSLKPSAERYLNEPPEEQNALHDWIVANVSGATRKNAGAFISRAPIELVRPYAIGDVTRTRRLFDYALERVPLAPYDRERELMPILIEGTRRGIRIDQELLSIDALVYDTALSQCADQIYAKLGSEFNIGSGTQLAEMLDRAGMIAEWQYTPTGRKSTAKRFLLSAIKDPSLADLIAYHSSLSTCLSTFINPWLDLSQTDGRVHPEWNQVRDTDRQSKGTKTGRLSSSHPNFQNVPNEFEQVVPAGLPPLPLMRRYCLPEEGHLWIKRDFSSQEVRWLAHFEDGTLLQEYIKNPGLDPHSTAQTVMRETTGKTFVRKHVKITAFTTIYGGGVPKLAEQMGVEVAHAFEVREAYLAAFPGVRKLQQAVSRRGKSGQGVMTWGGRLYFTEPHPQFDFSYKLLNYLIQGSSADQTKQAIIDWNNQRGPDAMFLATVHDEINISAPADYAHVHAGDLQRVMDQSVCDCPMRSEGFIGPNWYDLEAS